MLLGVWENRLRNAGITDDCVGGEPDTAGWGDEAGAPVAETVTIGPQRHRRFGAHQVRPDESDARE